MVFHYPELSEINTDGPLFGTEITFLQNEALSPMSDIPPIDSSCQKMDIRTSEMERSPPADNTTHTPQSLFEPINMIDNTLHSLNIIPEAPYVKLEEAEGRKSSNHMPPMDTMIKDAVKEQLDKVVTKLVWVCDRHEILENRLLSLQEDSKIMRKSIDDLKGTLLDYNKQKEGGDGLEVVHKTLRSVESSLQSFIAQTTNPTSLDQKEYIERSKGLLEGQGRSSSPNQWKIFNSSVEGSLPELRTEVENSNGFFQRPEGFPQYSMSNSIDMNALEDKFNSLRSIQGTTFQNTLFNDPILEYTPAEGLGNSFSLLQNQQATSIPCLPATSSSKLESEALKISSSSLPLSWSEVEPCDQHNKGASRRCWTTDPCEHGNISVGTKRAQEIERCSSSSSGTTKQSSGVGDWLGWKPASCTAASVAARNDENAEEWPRTNSPQLIPARVEAKRKGTGTDGNPLSERQENSVTRIGRTHPMQKQQAKCKSITCTNMYIILPLQLDCWCWCYFL